MVERHLDTLNRELGLVNRKDLMGEHRNSATFNAIAWVTCIVMFGLTALSAVSPFFPNELPK